MRHRHRQTGDDARSEVCVYQYSSAGQRSASRSLRSVCLSLCDKASLAGGSDGKLQVRLLSNPAQLPRFQYSASLSSNESDPETVPGLLVVGRHDQPKNEEDGEVVWGWSRRRLPLFAFVSERAPGPMPGTASSGKRRSTVPVHVPVPPPSRRLRAPSLAGRPGRATICLLDPVHFFGRIRRFCPLDTPLARETLGGLSLLCPAFRLVSPPHAPLRGTSSPIFLKSTNRNVILLL